MNTSLIIYIQSNVQVKYRKGLKMTEEGVL